MKFKTFVFLIFFSLILSKQLFSQGCSDAGFCTIAALKAQEKLVTKNRISVGSAFGQGDENVFVATPYIQYDRTIGKFIIQGKFTANYASGNLGKTLGLGDLFVTGTYTFNLKHHWAGAAFLGTKIFTNQASITNDEGLGLPMVYQSSIGTIDVLGGISFSNKHWKFAFGFQQPLTGFNLNTFLPSDYKGTLDENGDFYPNPLYDKARKYPPGNHLDRKGDILVNIAFTGNITKLFRYQLGTLTIFHLGLDTYVDPNDPSRLGSRTPIPIVGSDGYTFNVTAGGWFNISPKISLGVLSGAPLKARAVRPDGLTRSWVIQPELIINF